jgi:choline dehydrogenase-like flavoprotein
MTVQDWGITYAELEPYYDKFECTAAVSGKAGNINGEILPGGNPFEAPRAREYPLPPLTPILASEMFTQAAKNNGYHPFPRPAANASRLTDRNSAPANTVVLPAFRLRGKCEREPADDCDPDRDAQSKF